MSRRVSLDRHRGVDKSTASFTRTGLQGACSPVPALPDLYINVGHRSRSWRGGSISTVHGTRRIIVANVQLDRWSQLTSCFADNDVYGLRTTDAAFRFQV